MSTKIEWTDETWNPIVGCTKVSAGCVNCYAERMARRQRAMGNPYYESAITGGHWNGKAVQYGQKALHKPIHWREPRKIFVCSMGDLFHESVPTEWLVQVFMIMAQCPQHTFQILTKRPQRMLSWFESPQWAEIDDGYRPKNLWLGVTIEDQDAAERIEVLWQTAWRIKTAKLFISCEPLLEAIDIDANYLDDIDWMIIGAETGPGARLCDPYAIQDLIKEAGLSELPVFVKSFPINGKASKDMNEWPEWARRQEFPK